ncbi:flagellar hook-basal body complex protein [Ruminococcaceae bacterium OttesenSCG-928-O06]|nr:flagellar hook-basal body complex protein [Ruminococcaceae bacterium OttesenSCG-928-O06]
MTAGTDYEVAGYTYTPAANESDYINFLAAISANTAYDAAIVGAELVLTAKAVGTTTAPAVEYDGTTQTVSGTDGTAPVAGSFAPVAGADLGDGTTAPSAKASAASNALGFSSTAFALRGGTAGGAQTIADMTAIYIATNGIITGLDSQGKTVTIGRIDLATFANPAGLNQAGSSNFTESANSGIPVLGQPGQGGAGQLVGGSLELSNVDLSREFSDMITTQRGYQANSRIITVSDTMLEELINLKR